MTLLQLVVLAVVQGLTEFLPISSSAHLVLIPPLTGWPDQGPLIDVAVHVGTLLAVIIYFRRDVTALSKGFFRGPAIQPDGRRDGRTAWLILLATFPILIVGPAIYFLGYAEIVRNVRVIAWTTIGFAIVLYIADRWSMRTRDLGTLTWGSALIVGIAQIAALVPGTSRAGITITAARALGFERQEAARFSMLLSIPTIAAAGLLAGREIYRSGETVLQSGAVAAGTVAFITALASIALFMKWLKRSSLTPFVIYRLVLGAGLLYWIYGVA